MISFEEFERQLASAVRTVKPRLAIGLDKVGHLAESLAAEYPGHQQPGWAPLAAATIRDKQAKGFPVPSPLKRTGEMAASYRKEVDVAELALVIGSTEKIALWQEMGTSRGIPPRPVCAKALSNSLPYARDVFGETAIALLTGKGVALIR
ncbi:hypothetical protein [Bradyrhizobium sp. ORS 86]|uniref:hypothetical protein n=1 Tax=Bradyrhizobium sp. ORS 86 TaxID=1685970 RepID=UPI003890874E